MRWSTRSCTPPAARRQSPWTPRAARTSPEPSPRPIPPTAPRKPSARRARRRPWCSKSRPMDRGSSTRPPWAAAFGRTAWPSRWTAPARCTWRGLPRRSISRSCGRSRVPWARARFGRAPTAAPPGPRWTIRHSRIYRRWWWTRARPTRSTPPRAMPASSRAWMAGSPGNRPAAASPPRTCRCWPSTRCMRRSSMPPPAPE